MGDFQLAVMSRLVLGSDADAAADEGVPGQGDAEVVPVDPGEPGGEVGGVPLQTAGSSKLPSKTLLDVNHRL